MSLVLFQGGGAGQLRPLEEAALLPLQDERQRGHRRPGPLRVSRVGQKGTAAQAGSSQLSPPHRLLVAGRPRWFTGWSAYHHGPALTAATRV